MLDEWSATGTFFPLGARAERFPEVIGAVAEAGHEIGCHGQNHRNALRVGPLRAFRDAARGFETLSPWLSCPRLFRPPFGKLDSIAWLLLRWKGVKLGWWTIDSGDTRGSQKDRTLVEEVRRCRGGVVLLHDFDRISGRDDHVLALLKELLMLARREGIRLVRLSELLD